MINIKNYTSTVEAAVTIERIERLLVAIGARSILKDYDQGKVGAIRFNLKVEWGEMFIVLPANVQRVAELFLKQKQGATEKQKVQLRAQAERTAWKLMEDWVRVQYSLIQLRQAEAAQVFMPYAEAHDESGKPTSFFQIFRAGQMKLLPGRSDGS